MRRHLCCHYSLLSLVLAARALAPASTRVERGRYAATRAEAIKLSPRVHKLTRLSGGAEGAEDAVGTRLYPATDALESGMLRVSETHSIYYAVHGNAAGKPVLFVHGGPGGGTTPNMARFFDPEAYRVVLVDQRGCGRSEPFASLEENTTWDLVADFEKVRAHLGIDRWQVFGGSWGSTLGLAYAVTHPARVTELVLRGIFLCRRSELDFLYEGRGTNWVYPDAWEAYCAAVPRAEAEEAGYIRAYGRRLRGELGEEEMRAAARAWSVWEGSVSRLAPPPADEVDGKWAADDFSLAFARIENHYFTSGGDPSKPTGFFERDGWLLEDAQLEKIRHLPCVIVQGRYDVVCPARSAYELHRALPGSELHLTLTGHSAFEPEIIERLVAATDAFR